MSTQSISILSLSKIAPSPVAMSRFVTHAGAQAGADAATLGVSRTQADTDERYTIDVLGTATVEAGAAIAVDSVLKSDASGRAITWATSGNKVAVALEAAGAAGEFIEVLLIPNV